MIKGLIPYFAKNRTAANLLMVFVIVSGLIAGLNLPVQLFPKIDLRIISVTVPFAGATAKEIEADINRRLEESIVGLRGVERVISMAEEGVGRLRIELTTFADSESVQNDVQNAIDGIENFPPLNAEQPVIQLEKVEPEVMTLAISSATATEDELRTAAENVQNELLSLPSVSHVELHGVRNREITIEVDEEQLRRYGLTIAGIAKSINRHSINLSFGDLKTDGGSIFLNTIAKRNRGEEFENIPIISQLDGTVITLGDIATVRDGFADQEVISELDGVPAAFVRVDADENQSMTEIADRVRAWHSSKVSPDHIKIEIWNDRSGPSVIRIKEIISNAVIGVILVFLCLVAVFDLRFAFWVTVGIPVSFIGSLLFFDISDLTLNGATIFGFFLLVGIVVDDAVVVGENIAAERQRGKSAMEAAIIGAKTMFAPIAIGGITTVMAFLPLLFITAERYQIVNVFPYIAFFVLLVSLIECFLILPAHLSHAKPWSLSPLRELQKRISDALDNLRQKIILPIFSWSVRHTILTPVIGTGVVIASLLLISSGMVRVIIFDKSINISDSVQAELYFPVGTPFASTLATAEDIVRAAETTGEKLGDDPIKSISLSVGFPAKLSRDVKHNVAVDRSHIASIRVHLNDEQTRNVTIPEFERVWREEIGNLPAVERLEFKFTRTEPQPTVAYSLRHDSRDVLRSASKDLTDILSTEKGIYSVTNNMTQGKRHFEVQVTDQGRLAGLTPAGIGQQLRASYHGLEVQRIQRGHDEIKVVVRYPRERRQNLAELSTERIHMQGGGEIPLSFVAAITESRELSTLSRIDGETAAFVRAYADESIVTPIQARRKIKEQYLPELLERYPGLNIENEEAARGEADLLKVLGILVPLVLLAMYVLVAAFLRSFWKPLVVVFGIPIAFAGAVISHWILGWEFTAMSIFGVVGVVGVIINDGLVLLHRYNSTRREDPQIPAIVAASGAMQHRFRAVLLTSLTTILALSPLLYERSEELIMFVPFVVSMLGGLIFVSLFTLFIMPSLVMLIEGRKE